MTTDITVDLSITMKQLLITGSVTAIFSIVFWHSTNLFVTAMSSEMSIRAWQKYQFKPYHPDSIVLGKPEILRHIISFLSKPLKF